MLISCTNKVMLKILQARLQRYVNWELRDVQAGFRKGRGTRDQTVNIYLEHKKRKVDSIKKKKQKKKQNYFSFIDYTKSFHCLYHNELKILKDMGISGCLTLLLKSLYQVKKQQLELDMAQWTGSKLWME